MKTSKPQSESSSERLAQLYLELQKRKCKKDLVFLMEEFLGYPNLAPFHQELATTLKTVETTKRRGLFLLPRGHLKSTTITISYVIQRILQDPNIRILITNSLLDNSKGFLREIKGHFEKNEKLRALFGDWVGPKWSETQIVVRKRAWHHKEPTVQVTSVDKSVVSQHYDLIIADDLENRETVSTKEQRTKGKNYYNDLLDLLEPGGTVIVIGTRWHYDDLYAHLIEHNETHEDMVIMKRQVWADEERKTTIFPQKFTPAYVHQLRKQKGSYEFSCQYLNEPVSEEDADFKREFFKWFVPTPQDMAGDIYITVDPALSKDSSADNTGIVVNSVVNGKWKVLEAYGRKMNATELVDELFYLYRKYQPNFVEMGIEDMMYTQALQYDITRRMKETGIWFKLTPLRHRNRHKEDRIRALIPLFERGNIELGVRCKELEDELVHFPAAKHDDVLDALAYQLDIVKPTRHHTRRSDDRTSRTQVIQPIFQRY